MFLLMLWLEEIYLTVMYTVDLEKDILMVERPVQKLEREKQWEIWIYRT